MQQTKRPALFSLVCAAGFIAVQSTSALAETARPAHFSSYDPVSEALVRGLTPESMDRNFDRNLKQAEYCDPEQVGTEVTSTMSCDNTAPMFLALI